MPDRKDTSQEKPEQSGRSGDKMDLSEKNRSDADRVMNKPNTSPKTAASAGLGQTGQSGERSLGANPSEPPGTPATQPPTRTVNTQPGEPYNDDTDLRH